MEFCQALTCKGTKHTGTKLRTSDGDYVCLCSHHMGFNNPIALADGRSINPYTGEIKKKS